MKRLLRVGGLLILVSLALAILLRVLLIPSEPTGEAAETAETTETTQAAAPEPAPSSAGAQATAPAPTPPPAPATAGAADAELHFDEGLAHLDTGRLKEARQSFQRALSLDANHTRAQTRLSLLEEEIDGKLDRHFDDAREAFQFLRYEEAISEWEMFLLLAEPSDSRYAEAQQGIAQAQAKLGR